MFVREKILIILILFPTILSGQNITTFAGNGVAGSSADGTPATAANINFPISGVFDKYGNYYFATSSVGCSIKKISPSGIITTVAGGDCGDGGDGGLATLAKLNTPQGIAIDATGNIYIADNNNNKIRKVDVSTGIITTIAGNGMAGFDGDNGPASAAVLNDPLDLCFDKIGNLYIADANNYRIRKINTFNVISTIAGNGSIGISGEGGMATNASFNPWGVCIDKEGYIYIADFGTGETRVLKVTPSGSILRVAGNPANYIYNGDNIPATSAGIAPIKIAIDNYNNLFIADEPNNRIRRVDAFGIIHTIGGNGISGYNGDNITSTSAQLNYPAGIALDSCDNLYIADSRNYRIRKVTFSHCNYLAVKNENLPGLNVSIYPNPTNDLIHIDNIKAKTTYRLLNIIGVAMQQGNLKEGNNTISMQSLPDGMYMLEIADDEGKRTVSKVVKQ